LSFRPSGPDRPPAGRPAIKLPNWPQHIVPILGGLVILGVLLVIVAGVWTDYLWFHSVHNDQQHSYQSVFDVTYGTRWTLFFIGGIFMVLVTGLNTALAFRLRPIYRPVSAIRPGVDAYRMAIDPHRRLLFGIALAVIGIIAGISAAGAWRTWILFANQVPFGMKDRQFKIDISFFVFTYPFFRLVLAFLFAAVLLSLAGVVLVQWLYGGLGWQGRRPRASVAARAHVFVLFGVFVLLKAAAYWVDRYGIDFSQRGIVTTGASYTDVNAVLPAKTVLAVIAVLCALLFFAGALRRSAMLPGVGFSLLVLSAILIGGVYPAIIQQFVVSPNALAKESPYITREIAGTRQAYAVGGARVTPYLGSSQESSAQLTKQVSALPGMRLTDPAIVSEAFQQLQQVKGFYQFPPALSVDRYRLPGGGPVPQDLAVAVRGLSGPPAGQGNWINSHLVYTHGFGFVAARANTVSTDGTPAFVEHDIPPTGDLGTFQPRVYFGEQQRTYVIVGGRARQGGEELDFPLGASQQNYTYAGSGGVPMGSLLTRVLYAIKFHEMNILLSGAINSHSKILYTRQPLARVAKVAPFLTLDAAPYPVVADNRILWVVDGYTTSDLYPYSERISMGQATASSQSPRGAVAGQPTGQINYLRNSVKAVVDAYSGNVTLYQWGPSDPILRTWMKAFPGIVQPSSAIPAYLRPHLRYPPDLFEVQRQILAKYHVRTAQEFYGGQNFWAVPNDPTGAVGNRLPQPPYYLTLALPGSDQPHFSLISTFAPRNRANLAAFVAVDSDPMNPGFGTIRVLELPQDTAIQGPSQVQNAFETFARASIELTQLRKGGSRVTLGNLITLPVGGGLLYVEPVYVSASAVGASGSYPTLQRVFVFFNGQPNPVGYGGSLQEALSQVFRGVPGQQPSGGGVTGPGTLSATVRGLLAQAQKDYSQAQAALRRGDFATFGADLAKMKKALDAAQKAARGTPGKATATPSPSPSP
jgi:uncharacterized protein